MRNWIPKRNPYLNEIIRQEGPNDVIISCSICNAPGIPWRCTDCLGRPQFCPKCCLEQHHRHPFHRMEYWTGTHYTSAWLWKADVGIYLGHLGSKCPEYKVWSGDIFDVPDMTSLDEPALSTIGSYFKPSSQEHNGGKLVCFVHTNGIHYLPIYPCACADHQPEDIQFMEMGFMPASLLILKQSLHSNCSMTTSWTTWNAKHPGKATSQSYGG